MDDLVLNARFLSRDPTGVDRTATELFTALRPLLDAPGAARLTAAMPARSIHRREARPPDLVRRLHCTSGRCTGHIWEQITLARHQPDAVLLSLCNTGPVLRRRQVVMIHDAQVFTQPDSYSPAFRRWYRWLLPRLARRALLAVTVSDHARTELERYGVAPPGKLRVIPNGADHILRVRPDHETLARHGLAPGRYLLAIGSDAPHKNISMAIRAAANRTNRSSPLVVVGGSDPRVFRKTGTQEGEGIRHLSRITDAELRALYHHAAALVFPSLTEGFGLPAAEAMASGCAVLATTGGAVPEVCGDAAILIDPTDTRAWTHAMERITTDTDLRQRLVTAGKRRAEVFTWDRAARLMLHHLSDLSEPGRRGVLPVSCVQGQGDVVVRSQADHRHDQGMVEAGDIRPADP